MAIQRTPFPAPIGGVNFSVGGTLVNDNEMTKAQDVYIDKQHNIRKKYGYETLGSNLPLNGTVQLVEQFIKTDGTKYLMAVTSKDFYVYDQPTDTWLFVTPTYITGTVNVNNGNINIAGNGTTWLTNVKINDQIGFGSTDANAITKWYTISQVVSNTSLQISVPYGEVTQNNIAYVIRKLSTGAATDIYVSATMNDLYIVSNGVDPIMKYAGAGLFTELGGSPPKAKYMIVYHDYLVLAFTIEGGFTRPRRIRWCDTGDPETWNNPLNLNNAGFKDLIDETDNISGLTVLYDRIIPFKTNTIYSGYLVQTTEVFQFDIVVSNVGAITHAAIGNKGDLCFFLGDDDAYSFNGIAYERIGLNVKTTMLSNLSPTLKTLSHSLIIPELDEWILFTVSSSGSSPDLLWTYNYRTKSWTPGTTQGITATGYYSKQVGYTWTTFPGIWINANVRWEDQTLVVGAPTLLYGDDQGNIYSVDYVVPDENGEAIDGWFDTKDFEMQLWDRQKYWARLDIFGAGNPVDLYYSIDEGTTYNFIGTYPLTGVFQRMKMDFRITSEKIRFRFRNQNAGEGFFIRMYEVYWEEAGRVVG